MKDKKYDHLSVRTSKQGVVTVTLDRKPENELNRELIEELGMVFEHLSHDEQARAVVLTGANGHFSSGADLKTFAELKPGAEFQRFSRLAILAFDLISDLHIPVIAAISGRCLGGGNGLSMACHFRIADTTATFGQTNVRLGICPGFGGTQRLAHRIGKSQALRICLSGDIIDAKEAARIGLVDLLVPKSKGALKEAEAMAAKIASYSKPVVSKIMELIVEGSGMPWQKGWAYEAAAFGELSKLKDFQEGLATFGKKRKPAFHDQ
ncbi:MAG: enoyl-CoA hydratase [Candidatus Sumerlaeota bacterium]|nr:enoyl-CoA hydratase [Candidatus Sumerlaeota bacterium]